MNRTWISFSVLFVVLLCASLVFADESLPKVVFDQGHNQQFLIGEKGELQLSNLADIVRGKGGEVVATSEPLSDNTLLDAAALVISGPFAQLQAEEVEAVARFVERGGHLAVMLHIGPPLAGLLERLDIDYSNAVLHERSNVIDKDINFRVVELTPHQLFSGVGSFSVYGGWALKSGREGAAIALTSAGSWVDLDGNRILTKGDALGPFEIVIAGSLGAGSFVVFGDDAIFQNRYLDQDNGKLAANLAERLIGR